MVISIRVHKYNNPNNTWSIGHVTAHELRKGDNLLVLHTIPFSSNAPDYIFIPSPSKLGKKMGWDTEE